MRLPVWSSSPVNVSVAASSSLATLFWAWDRAVVTRSALTMIASRSLTSSLSRSRMRRSFSP